MAGYVNKALDVIKSNFGDEAVIAVNRVRDYKARAQRGVYDTRGNIALAQRQLLKMQDDDIVNAAYVIFADAGLVCGDTLLTRIVMPGEAAAAACFDERIDIDDNDTGGGVAAMAAASDDDEEADRGVEFVCDGTEEREALATFLSVRRGNDKRAVKVMLHCIVKLSAEIVRRALARKSGKRGNAGVATDLHYNSSRALDISNYALQRLLHSRCSNAVRKHIEDFADTSVGNLDVEERHRRCAIAMLAPLCRSGRALYKLMQLPAERVFALLLQTGASVRNRYPGGVPQAGRLPRLTVAVIASFAEVAAADIRGLDVFTGIVRAGRGNKVVYPPQPVRRHKHKQKNTAAAVPRCTSSARRCSKGSSLAVMWVAASLSAASMPSRRRARSWFKVCSLSMVVLSLFRFSVLTSQR